MCVLFATCMKINFPIYSIFSLYAEVMSENMWILGSLVIKFYIPCVDERGREREWSERDCDRNRARKIWQSGE